MTLRRLRDIVNMVAEDERLLDSPVYVSRVTNSGADIFGPTMLREYDRSGESLASHAYFTLPWGIPKSP